ncbi:hypothetical protein, conserved [Eimeria tenella]|uniref:CRAL-TRIO domain-containing protein n=1 Tax=Eimeria tenella TaxID=5802 RepID=U6L0X0_EIMTE|nr:hypothetical protein, conserved [Eimeria tenella]CDJ42843.1 hypothetical protein, conserved [Eimeria tenella]|eukprot:XP_013233593.1 hypothetical protein, conserved [Eimeria tenella]
MRRMRGVGLWVALVLAAAAWRPCCGSSKPLQQQQGKLQSAAEPRRRYSPPPLSEPRRRAALQLFEKVHPMLTIHYNGFSHRGSLVCYDMLNELRTVEEARAVMDVEFHLLDLMLEKYKVKKHMRIVDANIVKNMLGIQSLFSFRFPEVISKVTRFIKDYDPILRVFLQRYLPHIELLVIVNVPSFLAPILPSIASRIMGIPSSKIAAIAKGSQLTRFMDAKYVPREFGNPAGLSVKHNEENLTASCLMLREIKTHLGEAALTEDGKALLAQHGPRLLGMDPAAAAASPATTSTAAAAKPPKQEEAPTHFSVQVEESSSAAQQQTSYEESGNFDDID